MFPACFPACVVATNPDPRLPCLPARRLPRAQTPAQPAEKPAVVPRKKTPLYNGKDLSGWKADVPARTPIPAAPASFIVREGLLVSLGNPKGHLITEAAYKDYRLEVEYRFPGKGGNCGVLVHASSPRILYKMFPKSIEVQMQAGDAGDFWCIGEDIEVPDMDKRRPEKDGQKWGGAEGDARRIMNLTDDSEKPLGEWNTMVVEARGNTIKVWVNGDAGQRGQSATVSAARSRCRPRAPKWSSAGSTSPRCPNPGRLPRPSSREVRQGGGGAHPGVRRPSMADGFYRAHEVSGVRGRLPG